MKSAKLLAVGLSGALCLSLAGFTYASAHSTDVPQAAVNEPTGMTAGDIFFNDVNGGQITTDGKDWVAVADYERDHATPKVEWWTADEYETWIASQKEELEALIGTDDGWYDGQGVFHQWTQARVDAIIAEYQKTLESIKNGMMYSKNTNDGDTCFMVPPTDDVEIEYSDEVRVAHQQ